MAETVATKSLKATPANASGGAALTAFLAGIGDKVRRQRAKRGMTRRQLAHASETSERYLAQIEAGTGNPSVSVLRAIAQALDLPASALLPETSGRPAALGNILDLLNRMPAAELAALAGESRRAWRCRKTPIAASASRSSDCAAQGNQRSGGCWRNISAGPSSSSIGWSRWITAPASPT
jgi:transcriptional regulator with XRE-family HTH domain